MESMEVFNSSIQDEYPAQTSTPLTEIELKMFHEMGERMKDYDEEGYPAMVIKSIKGYQSPFLASRAPVVDPTDAKDHLAAT